MKKNLLKKIPKNFKKFFYKSNRINKYSKIYYLPGEKYFSKKEIMGVFTPTSLLSLVNTGNKFRKNIYTTLIKINIVELQQ